MNFLYKEISINDFLLKKLTCGDFIQTYDDKSNAFFYDAKNKINKPILGVVIDKFELYGNLVYKDILHDGLINQYDTNLFLYASQKKDYVDFRMIYMSQSPELLKQQKPIVIKNGNDKKEIKFLIKKIDYVDESVISWFDLNNKISDSFNRSIFDFYNWIKAETKIDVSFEKF